MSGKDVIFILGVGRSGTSALTRVLSLCGCSLPESLFGAADANPRGFWEPVDFQKLNGEFMARHGTGYPDPTMRLQELMLDQQEKEDFVAKIQALLAKCPCGPVLLVKELPITELMEFWVEAARREGFSVKVVIPIRHPSEVFASYAAFARGKTVSAELVNAFWTKLNLLAERHSRDLPRVFVEYSNLLKDWRVEVGRVASALSIDLKPDVSAIETFLTGDLHRQRCAGAIRETFGYDWMTRVYSIFSAAARDESVDARALDEIYLAYRACERTFRIASEEFPKVFDRIAKQQILKSTPVWKSGHDF